jgi:hypothetical protein
LDIESMIVLKFRVSMLVSFVVDADKVVILQKIVKSILRHSQAMERVPQATMATLILKSKNSWPRLAVGETPPLVTVSQLDASKADNPILGSNPLRLWRLWLLGYALVLFIRMAELIVYRKLLLHGLLNKLLRPHHPHQHTRHLPLPQEWLLAAGRHHSVLLQP